MPRLTLPHVTPVCGHCARRPRTTRGFPRGGRLIDHGRAPRKADRHAVWVGGLGAPPLAGCGGRQRAAAAVDQPVAGAKTCCHPPGAERGRPLGQSGSSTGGGGAVEAPLAGASPRGRGGLRLRGEGSPLSTPWPPRRLPCARRQFVRHLCGHLAGATAAPGRCQARATPPLPKVRICRTRGGSHLDRRRGGDRRAP